MNDSPIMEIQSGNHTNISASIFEIETVTQTTICLLTGLACLVGIIGNSLNTFALTRHGLRRLFRQNKSAHVGFLFLAVSDVGICLISFPRLFIYSDELHFDHNGFKLFYQKYGVNIADTMIFISTWLTVQLAVGRCVIVGNEMRLGSLTGFRTLVGCCTIVVLSILVCLPQFWQSTTVTACDNVSCIYYFEYGPTGAGVAYDITYWLQFILGYVIPLLIMLGCNVHLAVSLAKSDRTRASLTHTYELSRTFSNRITPTLMCIIFVYILLITPSEILEFIFDNLELGHVKNDYYLIARSVANLLQVLNFAINFLLHIGINKSYRQVIQSPLGSSCYQTTRNGRDGTQVWRESALTVDKTYITRTV